MKDNSRSVESSGRKFGPALDRAWKSVFTFSVLMFFGVGIALLGLSWLYGAPHQASSAVALLLIYVPFWKLFTKRSKIFIVTAILAGILFMLAFSTAFS